MTVRKRLTRRAAAWLSMLLLLIGLLPLYALALYNHAFYDDFGFSLLTRDAWQTTHSVLSVVEAAVRNTAGIRQTWEGTYATSFFSTFQPAVFGEGAYWVTTFLLLTVFMLSVWFFLKQSLGGVYGMDRTAVFTAFGVLGFVLVQFVPDAAEAFFWFNGGVAYTLLWSVLLFAAGVWLKLERARGGWRCTLLTLLLAVLMVLLGGAKYSTVLFAALLALSATAWAFFKRRPKRWIDLLLTALLLAGFAFSMAAPGNAVRARTLTGGMSAPKAVLEAVYFGLALLGHSFSLPLLAAMVLLVPLSIPALRRSGFAFGHPIWVTLLCVTLFCAQLAPTLYTGNYLGDGRVLNTYHYALVLMLAQVVLYWTGYFVRRSERGLSPVIGYDPFFLETPPLPAATDTGDLLPEGQTLLAAPEAPPAVASTRLEEGLKAVTLALVAGLLLVGCIAYHPDSAASYGPQNMAGGNALRAVLDGQAAAYDAAMDARDATLNDPALQDVVLTPVSEAPAMFMGDALQSDNLEYVLNLYADYYDKATVRVADTGD